MEKVSEQDAGIMMPRDVGVDDDGSIGIRVDERMSFFFGRERG